MKVHLAAILLGVAACAASADVRITGTNVSIAPKVSAPGDPVHPVVEFVDGEWQISCIVTITSSSLAPSLFIESTANSGQNKVRFVHIECRQGLGGSNSFIPTTMRELTNSTIQWVRDFRRDSATQGYAAAELTIASVNISGVLGPPTWVSGDNFIVDNVQNMFAAGDITANIVVGPRSDGTSLASAALIESTNGNIIGNIRAVPPVGLPNQSALDNIRALHGTIGSAARTPTIQASGSIKSVIARQMWANIVANQPTGGYGQVWFVKTTDGAFHGSIDANQIVHDATVYGPDVSGIHVEKQPGDTTSADLDVDITLTDYLAAPIAVQGRFLPSRTISVDRNVGYVSNGNNGVMTFGQLSGNLIFRTSQQQSVTATGYTDASNVYHNAFDGLIQVAGTLYGSISGQAITTTLGDASHAGLEGQIIVGASGQGGSWVGQVRPKGSTSSLTTPPYYSDFANTLGGGAVGLVPYQLYNTDCLPVRDPNNLPPTTIDPSNPSTDGRIFLAPDFAWVNGSGPSITLSWYGPVYGPATHPVEIYPADASGNPGPMSWTDSFVFEQVDSTPAGSLSRTIRFHGTPELIAGRYVVMPVKDGSGTVTSPLCDGLLTAASVGVANFRYDFYIAPDCDRNGYDDAWEISQDSGLDLLPSGGDGVLDVCQCFLNLDANQDGNSDQGDVDYLINAIAGGGNPQNFDLDFNNDGNADQADVDALITAIAGGPCPY